MEKRTKAGFVAIVGKPNVGKSTLLNSVLETKLSIVTPKPQTTRKPVLGIYSTDSVQIVFYDTPGILKPKYELQRSMKTSIYDSMNDCDVISVIIDVSKYKSFGSYFPQDFTFFLSSTKKPSIAILNKIDLLDDIKKVLPIIADVSKTGFFKHIIPISALKESNTKEIISVLEQLIPENPFFYDPEMLSIQNERFFVSEIIRENIFSAYQEEIPYSTEVLISEFVERDNGKWYISADIIVEKKSQKGIIIGNQGNKIKEIGEKSRLQIEEHLQIGVFLKLFVKVREKWRNNKNILKSLGY